MSRRRGLRSAPTDVGTQTIRYGSSRLLPYTPPWAMWAALPLLVAVARGLAGGSQVAAMLVAAGLTLSVLGLTAFTWHAWKSRGRSLQVHATAFTAAAGAWTLVAAIVGLVVTPDVLVDGRHFYRAPAWLLAAPNWPVWGVWVFAGVVGCLTWSIRRAGRGDGEDKHKADDGGLMETIGIAGKVGKPQLEANGTRVRVPVQLEPGKATAKDLQGAKGNIASYTKVRESGVRVKRNPDDFSQGDVVIVPLDQLKGRQEWTGPHAPGESIAVELHVARAEDGDVGKLWLPGDPTLDEPRNATHIGIAGMSGAGKTEGALTAAGEILPRRDVSMVWSDHVKGLQSVESIAAGIGLLLIDKPSAVAGFRRLPVVISQRTAYMGKHGFSQWTPEVFAKIGLKYLVYWLEEGAALIANSETFVQLTEQARSAGISIVLSQQRFSHDRVPTSARSNLGAGWCFGTKDETDAGFVLSESTLDAGAAPWEWQNRKPGYLYLEGPGIAEERWSMPHRILIADRAHLREVIREWSPDPALDPITATAFGTVYGTYRSKVLEGKAEWQTAPAPTTIPVEVSVPKATDPDVDDEDQADDEDTDVRDDPDMNFREQPEPGFMDKVDPAQEIPEDDHEPIPLGPPPGQARPTASAARKLLLAELTRQAMEGADVITTTQLAEYRKQVLRRSPSWLSGVLRELVAEGVLEDEPDRGAYRLLSVPVPG